MAPGSRTVFARRLWLLVLATAVCVQSAVAETGYSSLNEEALGEAERPNALQVEAADASHKWREANEGLKAATARGASQQELSRWADRVQVTQKRAKQAELRAFSKPSSMQLGDSSDPSESKEGDAEKDETEKAVETKEKVEEKKEEAADLEKEAQGKQLKQQKLERVAEKDAKELSAASGEEKDVLKASIAAKESKAQELSKAVKEERAEAIKAKTEAAEQKAEAPAAAKTAEATEKQAAADRKRAAANDIADKVGQLEDTLKSGSVDDRDLLKEKLEQAKSDQLTADATAQGAEQEADAATSASKIADLEAKVKVAEAKMQGIKDKAAAETKQDQADLKSKIKLQETKTAAGLKPAEEKVKELAKEAKVANERGASDEQALEDRARSDAKKVDSMKDKLKATIEKETKKVEDAKAVRDGKVKSDIEKLQSTIDKAKDELETEKKEAKKEKEFSKEKALNENIKNQAKRSEALTKKVKELEKKKQAGASVSEASQKLAQKELDASNKQLAKGVTHPDLFEKRAKAQESKVAAQVAMEKSAKKEEAAAAIKTTMDQARESEFKAQQNQKELKKKMVENEQREFDFQKESTMQAAEVKLSKVAIREKSKELEKMEAQEMNSKSMLKKLSGGNENAQKAHTKAKLAEESAKKILSKDSDAEEVAAESAKASKEGAAKANANHKEAASKEAQHSRLVEERKEKDIAAAKKRESDLLAQKAKTEETAAKLTAETKSKKIAATAAKEASTKKAQEADAKEKFQKQSKEVKEKTHAANIAIEESTSSNKEATSKKYAERQTKSQRSALIAAAPKEVCSPSSCQCPKIEEYTERVSNNEPCDNAMRTASSCCKDLCAKQPAWKTAGCTMSNSAIEKLVSQSMLHATAAEKAKAQSEKDAETIADLEAKLNGNPGKTGASELKAKLAEARASRDTHSTLAADESAKAKQMTAQSVEQRNARAASQIALINKTTDKSKLKQYLKENTDQKAKLEANIQQLMTQRKLELKRQQEQRIRDADAKAEEAEKAVQTKMDKVEVLKREARAEERKAQVKLDASRELVVKAHVTKQKAKESSTKKNVASKPTKELVDTLKEHMKAGTKLQARIKHVAEKKEEAASPSAKKIIALQVELQKNPDENRLKQMLAETSAAANSLREEIAKKVKKALVKKLSTPVTNKSIEKAKTEAELKALLQRNAKAAAATQAAIKKKLRAASMSNMSTDQLATLFHSSQQKMGHVQKQLDALHKASTDHKKGLVRAGLYKKVEEVAGAGARKAVENAVNAKDAKNVPAKVLEKAMSGDTEDADQVKAAIEKAHHKALAQDEAQKNAIQLVNKHLGVDAAAQLKTKLDTQKEIDAASDKDTQKKTEDKVKALQTIKTSLGKKAAKQVAAKFAQKEDKEAAPTQSKIKKVLENVKAANKAAQKVLPQI